MPAVIFNGTAVKALKDVFRFKSGKDIINFPGTIDPSVAPGVPANLGDIIINDEKIFIKVLAADTGWYEIIDNKTDDQLISGKRITASRFENGRELQIPIKNNYAEVQTEADLAETNTGAVIYSSSQRQIYNKVNNSGDTKLVTPNYYNPFVVDQNIIQETRAINTTQITPGINASDEEITPISGNRSLKLTQVAAGGETRISFFKVERQALNRQCRLSFTYTNNANDGEFEIAVYDFTNTVEIASFPIPASAEISRQDFFFTMPANIVDGEYRIKNPILNSGTILEIDNLEIVTNLEPQAFNEYNAVVGQIGTDVGATHATLKEALDVAPDGWKIFVIRDEIIDVTPVVLTNNIEIVFRRGVTLSKGLATIGLQIDGNDCKVLNSRFLGFNVAGDFGVTVSATANRTYLDAPRFNDCDTNIDDQGIQTYINVEYTE